MNQRDIVIRTIIGEAANEGPEGWAAVASVLRNRAADPRWPDQVGTVALQPKQFSAWNEGAGGNSLVHKYKPGDATYDRVGQVVDQVMAGQMPDPTGGATHYYSPRGMDALVSEGSQSNRIPRWLTQESQRRAGNNVTIGGHIFTGLAEGSPPPQAMNAAMGAPMQGGYSGPTRGPAPQQGGFSQDQIARAFERNQPAPERPTAAPQQQMQQAPDPIQRAAYQAPEDGLTRALRMVQQFKQSRQRGLLG